MVGSEAATKVETTPSPEATESRFVVALIPAYQPERPLPDVVRGLLNSGLIRAVVVVDDGSSASFQDLFDEISSVDRTHILRHVVNLGKGAALKTGLNFCACLFSALPE
jgi:glycosyltransferase involved in cell wall biosynthesis